MGPPTSINNSLPPLFQLLLQDVTATTPGSSFTSCQPAAPGFESPALTAATPPGARPLGLKGKGLCTFKGLVQRARGVCWKQLPLGPFKIPNSSAASDLDSLWPQRVAVAPSGLSRRRTCWGRYTWLGVGGVVAVCCACRFLPFRLGDPAVAEKDRDRGQGTEGN